MEERREAAIHGEDLPANDTLICSMHFQSEAFKWDCMAELLHEPGMVQQKDDAVPSIFPNCP